MTVGQLKEQLHDVPDDALVLVDHAGGIMESCPQITYIEMNLEDVNNPEIDWIVGRPEKSKAVYI